MFRVGEFPLSLSTCSSLVDVPVGLWFSWIRPCLNLNSSFEYTIKYLHGNNVTLYQSFSEFTRNSQPYFRLFFDTSRGAFEFSFWLFKNDFWHTLTISKCFLSFEFFQFNVKILGEIHKLIYIRMSQCFLDVQYNIYQIFETTENH